VGQAEWGRLGLESTIREGTKPRDAWLERIDGEIRKNAKVPLLAG
jgi:hypothetical protein